MTGAPEIETTFDEERVEIEEEIAILDDDRLRALLRRLVTYVHARESQTHARLRRELSDLEARVDALERDWERDDEPIP